MDALPDFAVIADADRVEAWSVRRLPFEPRDTMLDFRAALRASLARLDPSVGRLRCVYSSTSTDLCDAENVLLYNVGMSSFARLANRSVTFERAHVVPSPPIPLSGLAIHHHLYTVDSQARFALWQVTGELASWESTPPARVDKAADWWWKTCSSIPTAVDIERVLQPFGLRVEVGGVHQSITSLMKPMLDGVIAAFHRDRSPAPEAVQRLASQLQADDARVRDSLALGNAALGSRVLVRPYRDGLQWNPADDLCVACSVESHGPAAPPVVRGQLLAVEAVAG